MATVLSPVPATGVARDGAQVVTPDLIATTSPTPIQPTVSQEPKVLELRANEYIKQENFNRKFTLPATETHGELCVTYAVAGLDSDDAPTMLFIGGLLGGRYLAVNADYIGTKRGMRIVVVDRPGIGGSTPVKPSLRLPVWLETVPVLMRTINTQHVSLCAHSCGVTYALNTIYSMPWILPPSSRKLYLLSPWVPPEHSGMTLLSISSHLPSALFNGFDTIIRFANSTIMPIVHFSDVFSGAVSAPFSTTNRRDHSPTEDGVASSQKKHERDDLCREYCGESAAEFAAQNKVLMQCLFSESVSGANHEALLCLRKEIAGSWGPCDNYESYADALEAKLIDHYQHAQREEAGSSTGDLAVTATAVSNTSATDTQHRFVLKAFWAVTDNMIGKKGEEYFDKCFHRFTRDGQSSNGEQTPSCLSYESEVVPDTDHDALCLPQYGALSKILDDILEGTG